MRFWVFVELFYISFEKEDKQLTTYRAPGISGPPYKRIEWKEYRYETLDCILTNGRWRNSVVDIENDAGAEIDSDHYPLVMTVQIKLKDIHKQEREEIFQ